MTSTIKKPSFISFWKHPIFIALLLGILAGWFEFAFVTQIAEVVSNLFIKFLQLISLPVVFFAILSALIHLQDFVVARRLGGKVIKYAWVTTFVAALIALACFLIINPSQDFIDVTELTEGASGHSYLAAVLKMIPNNVIAAFSEGNIFGVVIIAFMVGLAALGIPKKQYKVLRLGADSLFHVFLKITQVLIKLLPLGIWAFATLFVIQAKTDMSKVSFLSLYFISIISANLIQAFVVLPLLLKMKGLSPLKVFKAVSPAVMTAFFSKSSSATLPLTIKCNIENNKISPKVANFTLPLCSVINMNGCAAFILITILFVGHYAGLTFGLFEMAMLVLVATFASIGNASVPMGCYFLASAILTSMGIPLDLMVVILTIYVFIDMVETALNVWSDCVVANIVDKEI